MCRAPAAMSVGEARLSIMAGGEKPVFDALLPLFEKMGKTIVYQRPAGAGQHTKMVNQVLIASNMIGVCEALLVRVQGWARPERSAPERFFRGSRVVELEQPAAPVIAGNFEPGFFVEHFLKDMGIALAEARRMKPAPTRTFAARAALSGRWKPRDTREKGRTPCCCARSDFRN